MRNPNNLRTAEKIVHSVLGLHVRRGDTLIGAIRVALDGKDAEIERLKSALAEILKDGWRAQMIARKAINNISTQ